MPTYREHLAGSDILSSGAGYGSARANAYKQTPAFKADLSAARAGGDLGDLSHGIDPSIRFNQDPKYLQAVVDTFRVQPKPQQLAILNGSLKAPSSASKAILDFLGGRNYAEPSDALKGLEKAAFPKQSVAVSKLQAGAAPLYRGIYSKYGPDAFSGLKGNPVSSVAYASASPHDQMVLQGFYGKSARRTQLRSDEIGGGLPHPLATRDKVRPLPKSAVQQSTGQLVEGDISNFLGHPIGANISQGEHALAVTGKFLTKPAVNAAKDAADLPVQTVASVGTIGRDLAEGKFKQAGENVVDPYEQLVKHPLRMLADHPLDTYLMAAGALHGATRPVAGLVRAVDKDSALSLERPSTKLTGKLTRERPQYSPYPLIQLGQKLVERAGSKTDAEGDLVARGENTQAKLIKREVSHIVGENERVRRANRDAVIKTRLKAVQKNVAVRAAKQAGRVLKRGSKTITIPGADELMSLVADGTIRRPDTFHADLDGYIKKISANRSDLLDRPDLLKEHDAKVKELTAALHSKKIAGAIPDLFRASDKYAADYKPLERDAAVKFGHFGPKSDLGKLDRRVLMHYAVAHMGARMEGEGDDAHLVVDRARDTGDGKGEPRVLPSHEIVEHIKSPEGLGGRKIAFTSDRPASDSGFYVSQARRPLPETAKNTMFSYTHGLQNMSHDALLRQHVRLQGVVDAHRGINRLLDQAAEQKPGRNGYWGSFKDAQRDIHAAGLSASHVPINVAQAFHPQGLLDMALEGPPGADPVGLDEEAAHMGVDVKDRLRDDGKVNGRWAAVSKDVLSQLNDHEKAISPNLGVRALGSLNSQWRRIALSTSPKHIPGIMSEQLIRDASSGVGFSSWLTGRRVLGRLDELNPSEGRDVRTRLTGGQLAGSTEMASRHFVAERYRGTNLYPVLKGFESFMRTPGPRQLRSTWNAWTHLVIGGTKHVLEQQHNIADVGKAALKDFGSQHGPVFKALRLHGALLDDAAKGLLDPKKLRQFRAEQERIRGAWNDLTPHGQLVLMATPFGLWWTNSARWLARLPVDHPVKSGVAASAVVGTAGQRAQSGDDLWAPNALPLYDQGGIPIGGGRELMQNYYSPFGIANDPLGTAESLIAPWESSIMYGAGGDNYLGHTITSPSNPKGYESPSVSDKVRVIVDSALGSFLPLYSKAEQVAEGGGKPYDTNMLFSQQMASNGKGAGAGLAKALFPLRIVRPSSGSSGGSSVPSLSGSTGATGGGDLKASLGLTGGGGGDLKASLK